MAGVRGQRISRLWCVSYPTGCPEAQPAAPWLTPTQLTSTPARYATAPEPCATTLLDSSVMFPTTRQARLWHGLTFAAAGFALLLQLLLIIVGHQHLGDSLPEVESAGRPDLSVRLVRFFSYLTIWFNILVAGTCFLLAVNPLRDGRTWRALRLDGVVIAVVGGVVHWFLLRPLLALRGLDHLADKLLHVVVPLMALIGWILFGPRKRVDRRDLLTFLVVPVVWLAYTLIRGALVGWYPYPFIDVGVHGYAAVGATCLVIAALMVALATGALWLDQRLQQWEPTNPNAP